MTVRLFVDQSTREVVVMSEVFAPLLPRVKIWRELSRVGVSEGVLALVEHAVRGVTAEEERRMMMEETWSD